MAKRQPVRPLPKNGTRRYVRFQDETPDNIGIYHTRSTSREGVDYNPCIQYDTLLVHCQCEHHFWRFENKGVTPTVRDFPRLCRHLQAAINHAVRNGRLDRKEDNQ